jgi:rfaE bifunctional protein nucleotidyltransferase chain/domain
MDELMETAVKKATKALVEMPHEDFLELLRAEAAKGFVGRNEREHGETQFLSLESKSLGLGISMMVCSAWRKQGKRIVFTNGCFDILHAGHVQLLRQARQRGGKLVVGLNSDASIRRLKGETRPVQCESDRIAVLSALVMVDLIVVFEQDTPLELIQCLRPDVLIKGGDYTPDSVVGAEDVRSRGGVVECLPFLEGRSTTGILARL